MPPRKTARSPGTGPRRSTRPDVPEAARSKPPREGSVEQAMDVWVRYARETADSVTDFLRRFGEEQQKNYETWAANASEGMRPKAESAGGESARTRLDAWNRQAEEVGTRIREAFMSSWKPQRELLELWAKPWLPEGASPTDTTREIQELVQKLWSGLTIDLTRRMVDVLQPDKGFEEYVQVQSEATKQFTQNFQKLTHAYFTSPAFVAAFGRTLSNSLDLEKTWKDSDEFFRRVTGLPTRREIGELHQAVRELTEQVSRLNERRA